MTKLFEFSHQNGNVKHYRPIKDVEIEAISEEGIIAYKKITDFSVHENLKIYKISDANNYFKPFWSSADHSLLIWDDVNEKVIKKSPLEILDYIDKGEDHIYFIQKIDVEKDTNNIKSDNIRLIPIDTLIIEFDESKTTAYDFTVEDYYTFRTSDGVFIQDSMACYFTITEEAENDLVDSLYIGNNLLLDYDNTTTMIPSHDIIYGIFLLSKKKPSKLPKPLYEYMVENNWDYINKKRLLKFLTEYVKKDKNNISIIDDIMTLGFMISTRYNQTILSIDNVINSIIPYDMREDLYNKYMDEEITAEEYMAEEQKLEAELKKICVFNDLIESGSRGSWLQAKQMFLQRGFVSNSVGETMKTPVMRNLAEGLDSRDLFLSCYGVRKGLADVADNTAVSGTFSRGLVYLGLEAKQGDSKEPCDTKRYIAFKPTDKRMCEALIGRYIFDDDSCSNMTRITEDDCYSYLDKVIRLRSPIFCTSKHFCHFCCPYKELDELEKGRCYNVGVAAAGSLGEPSTQMVLRVFHNSGAVTSATGSSDEHNIVGDLRGVMRLFSKPEFTINNVDEYVKKVYLTYRNYKQIKMLYFEVLISTLMWVKQDAKSLDQDILWRLDQDKVLALLGFNKVPGMMGFLLGCAFKNFKRKLLTSLNKNVGESVFEKLIIE